MNMSALNQCILFRDLSEQDLTYAFSFFHARQRHFQRGEVFHRAGEPVRHFGLLLSGSVHVFMDDFEGNRLLMASVVPGNTFAESLCFLGGESQVTIECMADSEILVMDTLSLTKPPKEVTPDDTALAQRFIAMLARRTLTLNNRIQILSKLTIREKVITLLSEYTSSGEKGDIVLPFNRESMATYLGVNQSALSRELSRMKADGIITYKRSHFRIL